MGARWWAAWAALALVGARARELDPAACGARFDVQRDKIIRTEESRDMGARYLSELDVGARAECLRLCCETDACDVFVYEEKGPGSCYLFSCGPPEDFRCKFTAHSNFSSGVLALSRRLAELQDQEQRAHREQELANLRSATSPGAAAATSPSTPPAPRPSPPHHTTPSAAAAAAPVAAAAGAAGAAGAAATSRCSRYQFSCRRGGECIAVYNACDGVPQCADGSDEAPELGCPPPPAPAPRATPPQDSAESEASASGEGAANTEHWPHRLAQAQPPRHFVPESGGGSTGGSHIFSHKGGLLQEAEGGPYAPFEPPATWPRRAWPPPPQAQPPPGESAWGGYSREWETPRRAWPVPPHAEPEAGGFGAQTMPEVAVQYGAGAHTLRDSAKKAPPAPAPPPPPAPPDLREERRDPDPPRHPAPHPNQQKAGAAGAAGAPERHLAAAADEHDGLSERPPAAVLLLVLGVLLTAALGGMAACRARAARRRHRRGKPFAHDADYLVNGMYL